MHSEVLHFCCRAWEWGTTVAVLTLGRKNCYSGKEIYEKYSGWLNIERMKRKVGGMRAVFYLPWQEISRLGLQITNK